MKAIIESRQCLEQIWQWREQYWRTSSLSIYKQRLWMNQPQWVIETDDPSIEAAVAALWGGEIDQIG